MANQIKDFFKKKKLDAKFKMAGSGHRLTDSNTNPMSGSASSSSHSNQFNANKTNRILDSTTKRAAEAAIDRIERQNNSANNRSKTNTLENILQEERKQISEEYKLKQKVELLAKEESKQDREEAKELSDFESKQRFSCPTIGLNESLLFDDLMKHLNDYIQTNFTEDLTLMSVMTIFNCNFSIADNYKNRVEQCVTTLDKIVTNLANSSPQEREKFKKIRKSKIENRVLQLCGGLEFLISIGFQLDSNEEWFVFDGDEEHLSDQMNYYKDVLNNVEQFPIILDRQPVTVEPGLSANDDLLTDEFFKLSANELSREMQGLTEKRELEQTLRTKAMREQKHKKCNSRFTRLRFKFPTGVQMDATFSSGETLSDVKTWLSQHLDSINSFNFKCGRDVFSDEHLSKSLYDLNLIPKAALLITSKEN